MNILITGGAGFIGSRLAKAMHAQGHEVTVLDSLTRQVHGPDAQFDPALRQFARCVRGDVRDRALLADAIAGQEVIVHLAAETGTGQSMYAVRDYEDVNLGGTAVLLDLLVNQRSPSLRKLMVASSRAIYGEGHYRCAEHGSFYPPARRAEDLAAGRFDPTCPHCGAVALPAPTPETAPFAPSSFYGLTKQVQEQMVLMFASTLGIDGVALRYQNVYGPGQSLSNPYTGLLAVFSNLVRQGKGLDVFEDGRESRDFVYVDDVVEATVAMASADVRGVHSVNVGSGVMTSVHDVARAVVAHFHADVPIRVTGAYRLGDIRHNVADMSQLERLTGVRPACDFQNGLKAFLDWAAGSAPVESGFERSLQELRARGLIGVATA